MGYIQTSFLEFRETLERHIKEMERDYPERYTTDWYFMRYLKRIDMHAHRVDSPRDVSGSMRGLLRFYVDSVEPGSTLAERFEEVLDAHRFALRTERRE
ncbi:MAG: hypothetical protein AAF384_02510 [Pseudomonadota bacterium]